MGSLMRKAAVLAAMILPAAGGTASATTLDVKVPFPFLVEGRELPAGTYRVESDKAGSSVVLFRGENGHMASAFVLTTPAPGRDPAGDKPVLTFKRYENQYRLAGVWESAEQGREVPNR